MIKFVIKVGLATTVVYYIKEQGLWKSSDESIKTYNKLKGSIQPYLTDLEAQIPYKIPVLPQADSLSSLAKQSWNHGVISSFKFLSNLPENIEDWGSRGMAAAMSNAEIQKFVKSLSNSNNNEKK